MSETEDDPESAEAAESGDEKPKKKKKGGKKKNGKKGGKGKGKLLTILIVLVFVLGITGGVVYFFFFTGGPPATEAVAKKGDKGKAQKTKPEEEEEVEIPFEEMTPEQQEAVLKAAEDEAIAAISGRYSPAGSVDGHILAVGDCATTFILINKDKLYRKSPTQRPFIDKLIGLKRDENTPFGKAKYALIAESKSKRGHRLHKFGLFEEEFRSYLIIIEVDKDKAGEENSGSTRGHYLPCTVAGKK